MKIRISRLEFLIRNSLTETDGPKVPAEVSSTARIVLTRIEQFSTSTVRVASRNGNVKSVVALAIVTGVYGARIVIIAVLGGIEAFSCHLVARIIGAGVCIVAADRIHSAVAEFASRNGVVVGGRADTSRVADVGSAVLSIVTVRIRVTSRRRILNADAIHAVNVAVDLVDARARKGGARGADGWAHNEVTRGAIVVATGIVTKLVGKEDVPEVLVGREGNVIHSVSGVLATQHVEVGTSDSAAKILSIEEVSNIAGWEAPSELRR